MKIAFIIYIVLISVGGVHAGFRAFRYWRGETFGSNKLVLLPLAQMLIDLMSVGIMLWLWLGSIAGEWSILFWGLIIVGVYTAAFRLYEVKLLTGKYRL